MKRTYHETGQNTIVSPCETHHTMQLGLHNRMVWKLPAIPESFLRALYLVWAGSHLVMLRVCWEIIVCPLRIFWVWVDSRSIDKPINSYSDMSIYRQFTYTITLYLRLRHYDPRLFNSAVRVGYSIPLKISVILYHSPPIYSPEQGF